MFVTDVALGDFNQYDTFFIAEEDPSIQHSGAPTLRTRSRPDQPLRIFATCTFDFNLTLRGESDFLTMHNRHFDTDHVFSHMVRDGMWPSVLYGWAFSKVTPVSPDIVVYRTKTRLVSQMNGCKFVTFNLSDSLRAVGWGPQRPWLDSSARDQLIASCGPQPADVAWPPVGGDASSDESSILNPVTGCSPKTSSTPGDGSTSSSGMMSSSSSSSAGDVVPPTKKACLDDVCNRSLADTFQALAEEGSAASTPLPPLPNAPAAKRLKVESSVEHDDGHDDEPVRAPVRVP
jgi:hypothetical protein